MRLRPATVGKLVLVTSLAAWVASAADFVGPESCRACHQAAYDEWKASPHARAWQVLTAEQQKDSKCLACHARDQAQGGDPGVTCETCHGAGQYYWPDYVMRDKELAHAAGLATVSAQDPKMCVQCHDGMGPTVVPFDPAEGMKKIDHWSGERADRECPGKHRQATARALPQDTFVGRALLSRPGKAPPARAVHVAEAARPVAGHG